MAHRRVAGLDRALDFGRVGDVDTFGAAFLAEFRGRRLQLRRSTSQS